MASAFNREESKTENCNCILDLKKTNKHWLKWVHFFYQTRTHHLWRDLWRWMLGECIRICLKIPLPSLFANALPLLQIMSMDIALAPPPNNARPGSLASRWVLRGHGLPAEALADHPSERPSLLLAWRSLCLCPTLKVCAWPPNLPSLNLFNLPLLLTSACHARTLG